MSGWHNLVMRSPAMNLSLVRETFSKENIYRKDEERLFPHGYTGSNPVPDASKNLFIQSMLLG
jgi:hypothetical protein